VPVSGVLPLTSRAYGYTVVTRHGDLIPCGEARHIEAVAC
jgi:hypothetical protein